MKVVTIVLSVLLLSATVFPYSVWSTEQRNVFQEDFDKNWNALAFQDYNPSFLGQYDCHVLNFGLDYTHRDRGRFITRFTRSFYPQLTSGLFVNFPYLGLIPSFFDPANTDIMLANSLQIGKHHLGAAYKLRSGDVNPENENSSNYLNLLDLGYSYTPDQNWLAFFSVNHIGLTAISVKMHIEPYYYYYGPLYRGHASFSTAGYDTTYRIYETPELNAGLRYMYPVSKRSFIMGSVKVEYDYNAEPSDPQTMISLGAGARLRFLGANIELKKYEYRQWIPGYSHDLSLFSRISLYFKYFSFEWTTVWGDAQFGAVNVVISTGIF
ncbi:MAG: hypothetical protein A2268_16845 [Candidatus Raymondbacteria bacterium RifOxyA12_full_50_37]|uniref:Uncharacterized protein n=1 Tax=Candidatus Raymondbacteria bacterium RIFOXYD12_FULL_49_13 TaxID=1817890 RepID=A0A1F7FCL3_UNCRA|nr:MAG: hypothetical protein A2268_16845 [Candidatus Raymondbacteria bacterium RifOxyA12_full_50_37]OGJ86278.1 MAG: hypothetical protein A2248_16440 [Candidatus Raymondbacteria bacterium RIFOXYA2_FULL_49_16]OGJ93618.1 MAG: hypothetical protein A2487_20170 [Candidatus Raymondbacteria bacterium RifOxyC12_full_50_8]OGJ95815.1 MAG: hypothetical protein A2453_11755 [Candidatus Raymondbacteria bacterium RIFOXYC2_FULL_50_21]OGJ99054.1 MAG: hypothetical protein A2350_17325 [Candidatus Raymondbacteria b